MAGIIQNAQNHEPGENEATEQETPAQEGSEGHGEGRRINVAAARQSMSIPPEKQDTYAKIVAAGKKILYSPQMDPEIQQLLEGEGDLGQKLGMGVFGLVSLLLAKSNGTLPADLLVPAGCELVVEAATMLEETGVKITDRDIARGASVFVRQVMQKAGIDENQLAQGVAGGDPARQPAPVQEPAPQQPVPQEA